MAKKMRNRKRDRKIFRRTADRSRKINVRPMLFRGGIRL